MAQARAMPAQASKLEPQPSAEAAASTSTRTKKRAGCGKLRTQPRPAAEQHAHEPVEGTIGMGSVKVIGCPDWEPDPTEPTVALESFRLEGAHSEPVVQRIVDHNSRDAIECYAKALARTELPAGALDVELTIDANGSVTCSGVRAREPTLAPVAQCLGSRLPHWTFVEAPNAGSAQVLFRYALALPELRADPADPAQ
jgi:hypothetical protein